MFVDKTVDNQDSNCVKKRGKQEYNWFLDRIDLMLNAVDKIVDNTIIKFIKNIKKLAYFY